MFTNLGNLGILQLQSLGFGLIKSGDNDPDSLISFLVKAYFEFPFVSCKALHILIPFATSYSCKAGFSAVAVTKSKYRNKNELNEKYVLRYRAFNRGLIKCVWSSKLTVALNCLVS